MTLVLMSGLPGVGKSAIADVLAVRMSAVVVSVDEGRDSVRRDRRTRTTSKSAASGVRRTLARTPLAPRVVQCRPPASGAARGS